MRDGFHWLARRIMLAVIRAQEKASRFRPALLKPIRNELEVVANTKLQLPGRCRGCETQRSSGRYAFDAFCIDRDHTCGARTIRIGRKVRHARGSNNIVNTVVIDAVEEIESLKCQLKITTFLYKQPARETSVKAEKCFATARVSPGERRTIVIQAAVVICIRADQKIKWPSAPSRKDRREYPIPGPRIFPRAHQYRADHKPVPLIECRKASIGPYVQRILCEVIGVEIRSFIYRL